MLKCFDEDLKSMNQGRGKMDECTREIVHLLPHPRVLTTPLAIRSKLESESEEYKRGRRYKFDVSLNRLMSLQKNAIIPFHREYCSTLVAHKNILHLPLVIYIRPSQNIEQAPPDR
jgi:hypothetical protein